MEKIAVFPGTFDPFTIGHESILSRALPLFDHIIIMLGLNSDKQTMFSGADRKSMIEKLYSEEPKIEVALFEGLTIDFCHQIGANYILRGVRTMADFSYEQTMAHLNNRLDNKIETLFFVTLPEFSVVSSSAVREILSHHGDASEFLPRKLDVKNYLEKI